MKTEEQKPENPNAFPFSAAYGHPAACGGMTLRDYFAAKSMSGLMSNPNYGIFNGQNEVHIPTIEQCYNVADAMLKQREL